MRFTASHEWIVVKGNVGTVGISDHAQRELGEIVYIELPAVGQHLSAGEPACVLESTKAAADVYAPVSGTVVAVNEALKTAPGKINQSAEGDGWLFQIALKQPTELASLLTSPQYHSLVH